MTGCQAEREGAEGCEGPMWRLTTTTGKYPSVAPLLLWVAAEVTGRTHKELVGKGRPAPLCQDRKAAMYALRLVSGMSVVDIGVVFKRDWSTINHILEQAHKEYTYGQTERDDKLRADVTKIMGLVGDPGRVCTAHLGAYVRDQTINRKPVVWYLRKEIK